MSLLSKYPHIGTIVLVIFFTLWLYTEITEYIERDMFQENVTEFMNKGDRFTGSQGKLLEERIKKLESCKQVDCE